MFSTNQNINNSTKKASNFYKSINSMKYLFYSFFSIIVLVSGCKGTKDTTKSSSITKSVYGKVNDQEVYLFTLTNNKGNQVKITNYGGIVTSWTFPNKTGKKENIVIGFDSITQYLHQPPYFGALIGRYGNRIANGKFKIDSTEYTLATNDGKNHLHGGNIGYDKVIWDAKIVNDTTPTLVLNYLSKDGEEGYPGNLSMQVRYTLTNDDELEIEYKATTDKPTIVNLTQHNYYNLSGDVNNTILNHSLMIDADNYTPVDSTLIPTGEIKSVSNTPFDFKQMQQIGSRIDAVTGGYDHNWVLNKKDTSLTMVATLWDEVSGRKMDVYTTEPGLQFYSGNFMNGKFINYDGNPLKYRTGLCLETQHFPNSPNQPDFPTTLLLPNQQYHSVTKYKLSLQ
jgi:aldose 1-epimerase